MRNWVKPILIIILVFVVPLPAWSVIIKTKDGQEYKGQLVKDETLKVTIKLQGSNTEKTFYRFDVVEMIQAVKPKELEKFKPENPKGYYDYAMDLLSQQEDPEARDAALRLFLISAYLEPVKLGHGSLLKMSDLARTSEEARTFRAMAYLLDVVSDKSILKKVSKAVNEDTKAREAFLKALEFLRRGKTKEALDTVKTKGAADYFGLIPSFMTYDEFVKICQENPECKCKDGRIFCAKCIGKGGIVSSKGLTVCPDCNGKGFKICPDCKGNPRKVKLNPRQTQIIIQMQMLHEMDPKAKLDSPVGTNDNNWSSLLNGSQLQPLPVLSLIYLTEFDPRKCVFKNGKWVEP